MEHEIVTAPDLAPPVGYAHAVLAAPGRVVALGGQTALGPDNTIVGTTMTEQFDVAAGNVVAALRAAGGEPSDIVSMQIFVTDVPAYKAALRELGPRVAAALRPPLPGHRAVRRHAAVRRRGAHRAHGAGRARGGRGMTAVVAMSTPLLDAHLQPDQLELLETTTTAARERMAPLAHAGDEGALNRPLVRELAATGLLDRLYQHDDEGWRADVGAMELCLIREGLARHCTEAETAFAVQGLGSFPLLQSGHPDAIAAWVPRLATGEAVAGFALTEPDSGSDVAAARAGGRRRTASGYRLSGEKIYISNAPDADVYSVFARTTEGAGARGLTAFWVPRDSPGLTGEPIELVSPAPHRPARLRGRARPAGARHGRGRPRLPRRDAHAGPLPPERRRVRRRDGAGRDRRRPRPRRRTARVRQAAQGLPGGLAPPRGRRHAPAGGAAARAPRGAPRTTAASAR